MKLTMADMLKMLGHNLTPHTDGDNWYTTILNFSRDKRVAEAVARDNIKGVIPRPQDQTGVSNPRTMLYDTTQYDQGTEHPGKFLAYMQMVWDSLKGNPKDETKP
jgi:hypothetical protein